MLKHKQNLQDFIKIIKSKSSMDPLGRISLKNTKKAFLIIRWLFCIKEMALDTTLEFFGAAGGLHVYRQIWRPFEEELLKREFKDGNLFDMFAIKACRSTDHDKIVDDLPHEISRPTKFSINRGAIVTATVWSKNVRRSPLFQGELKILCRVKVVMPKILINQLLLDWYREMVRELHEEPERGITVVTFDNNEDIELEPRQKEKKNNTHKTNKKELSGTKNKSILSLFKKES